MQRIRVSFAKNISALVMSFFIFCTPAFAFDKNWTQLPTIGVCRSNLAWVKNWRGVIDAMAAHHVRAVRLSYAPNFDTTAETIIYAKSKGLAVLLVTGLSNPKYYDGKMFVQKTETGLSIGFPLSQIDVGLYKQALIHLMQRLDAAGVSLDALEVGNEINWSCFNGDISPAPRNQGGCYASVAQMGPSKYAFLEGMKKYTAIVHIAKNALAASRLQRNTLLVSAGLASNACNSHWIKTMGGRQLSLDAMNEIYVRNHIADLFDARAIHLYPDVRNNAMAAIDSEMISGAKMCSPNGQPCLITESGFFSTDNSCFGSDARKQYFDRFFRDAQAFPNIKSIFVYSWDDRASSVFRCNEVKAVGRWLH